MRIKGHTVKDSCSWFNKSRQGYYDRINQSERESVFRKRVLLAVKEIRKELPYCGTRKMWYMLNQKGLPVGRDRLFGILREEGLLIKRKRRYISTTDSSSSLGKYTNLIKDMTIEQAEEVFVSDITYLRTREGFVHLALVIDAYSKKIMGKFLSENMQTTLVLKSLVESLKNKKYNRSLIHHSDQGSQYNNRSYIRALKLCDIMISMSGKGRAWENGIAERTIGILKQELGLNTVFDNYDHADQEVNRAIDKYNSLRPHLSCGYLTPVQAHEQGKGLTNVWKKKLSTFPQDRRCV